MTTDPRITGLMALVDEALVERATLVHRCMDGNIGDASLYLAARAAVESAALSMLAPQLEPGVFVMLDRPGCVQVATMRHYFEGAIRETASLTARLPLDRVVTGGEFQEYMRPEVQSAWVGFGLGMRCAERLARHAAAELAVQPLQEMQGLDHQAPRATEELLREPSDDDLHAAFAKSSGGPNPYFRCNRCGMTEPGVRNCLAEHWVKCTAAEAKPVTVGASRDVRQDNQVAGDKAATAPSAATQTAALDESGGGV